MTLDELYKKYGDVEVFVAESIYADASQTFRPANYTVFSLANSVGVFKPRYEMEIDTKWRQIIPYCLIKYQDKYYISKRLKGDSRLIGKISIGFGGHIDKEDVNHDGQTGEYKNPIKTAMERELNEELNLDKNTILSINLQGTICSDKTEVDKVHWGFVFIVEVSEPTVSIKETNELKGEWINSKDMKFLLENDTLESWSRICIENINL